MKYLIGITPVGAVNLLFHGWCGHVWDKEITLKLRVLNYLQHQDYILADFEFKIAEELVSCRATLKILHFTKGKPQMSDVGASQKISSVHITGPLRKFRILEFNIPITQVKLLNDAMVIIAGLGNVNNSVVSK